jgi:hypothetical protein
MHEAEGDRHDNDAQIATASFLLALGTVMMLPPLARSQRSNKALNAAPVTRQRSR